MVIIDTNIIIDHLRRKNNSESALDKISRNFQEGEKIAVSILSVQELYAGQSLNNLEEEQRVLKILSFLEVIGYNVEIAKKAGEIIRQAKGQIRPIDAALAATAIIFSLPLYTLNQKDFAGIAGLKILSI